MTDSCGGGEILNVDHGPSERHKYLALGCKWLKPGLSNALVVLGDSRGTEINTDCDLSIFGGTYNKLAPEKGLLYQSVKVLSL